LSTLSCRLRRLAEQGHVAEHVADVGLLSASGSEIWRYAIEHDAALISKDEDFPCSPAISVARFVAASAPGLAKRALRHGS
jgi:predicted nuclease of predicted toxin-antitoxin system